MMDLSEVLRKKELETEIKIAEAKQKCIRNKKENTSKELNEISKIEGEMAGKIYRMKSELSDLNKKMEN